MKGSLRFLVLGTILVLFAALAVAPLTAQEDGGGIIIEGNLGGDPATFNPIIASDTASRRITGFIYPAFLAVDPSQAVIVPSNPPLAGGALVQDWEVSEDGTVYTFNLREDLTWSDGTPITSADIIYTWNAIQAGSDTEEMIEIASKRNPFGRLTRPEDVADVLALLVHDEASFLTGNVLGVDGGEDIVG